MSQPIQRRHGRPTLARYFPALFAFRRSKISTQFRPTEHKFFSDSVIGSGPPFQKSSKPVVATAGTGFFRHRAAASLAALAEMAGDGRWIVNCCCSRLLAGVPGTIVPTRRALVETIFLAVKRKLPDRAPGRCLLMQLRQALLPGLACNLYRL